MNQTEQLRNMVYASLFAALICAGAYIAIPIPISPVPVVLQNFFVILAGLLLGSRWGLASVAVYLLAGAIGLPVFAGAKGGIIHFAGITGGYLVGYLPAVFIIGWISEKGKGRISWDILGMVIGSFIVYLFGLSWMVLYFGKTFSKALAIGCLPFLFGDILKIAAAASVAKVTRPVFRKGAISGQLNENPAN